MKRHKDLFNQISTFENLLLASRKAFRSKKLKAPAARFYFHLENELLELQNEVLGGSYHPRDYRLFEIREPKVRQICSSHFRDRVIHHAICNVIDPILEKRLIHQSYACRVGKGSHTASACAQTYTKQFDYYLKCDVRKYFESIDHAVLKRLLRKIFKDQSLLKLMDIIIDHEVPGNPPGKGLPIGNLTSQHFANLYLGELDHFLKERLQIKGYVRYMDDFICFSNDKQQLWDVLAQIRVFLKDKLDLVLKDKVVRIAPVSEGVPFLGFRIFKNTIRLQRSNLIRFRKKVKEKETAFKKGAIDEAELFKSVNSMVAHISHANTLNLRRKELEKSLGLA